MSSQVPLNKFFNVDWQNWKKPMVYALLASLVLHATLLAFKWHAESEQERRLKTPLSVVLVNASSPAAPINPKRLAQVNLNGGGELTEGQASALRRADPKLAEQLEKIQADQKRLLSQISAGRENKVSNQDVLQSQRPALNRWCLRSITMPCVVKLRRTAPPISQGLVVELCTVAWC
jgi:protein TonB